MRPRGSEFFLWLLGPSARMRRRWTRFWRGLSAHGSSNFSLFVLLGEVEECEFERIRVVGGAAELVVRAGERHGECSGGFVMRDVVSRDAVERSAVRAHMAEVMACAALEDFQGERARCRRVSGVVEATFVRARAREV